jgi:hypothetical protein
MHGHQQQARLYYLKDLDLFKTIAGAGGISKGVIRKTYLSFDELGNPVYDDRYWMDVTQAASSTPLDTNEPTLVTSIGALDEVSEWAAIVTYRITYHTQWFELNVADVVPTFQTVSEDSSDISEAPPIKKSDQVKVLGTRIRK